MVDKNKGIKSQSIMNHGTSRIRRMGNPFVSDGGLKNEKKRKRKN
jgi:hypothetical protein